VEAESHSELVGLQVVLIQPVPQLLCACPNISGSNFWADFSIAGSHFCLRPKFNAPKGTSRPVSLGRYPPARLVSPKTAALHSRCSIASHSVQNAAMISKVMTSAPVPLRAGKIACNQNRKARNSSIRHVPLWSHWRSRRTTSRVASHGTCSAIATVDVLNDSSVLTPVAGVEEGRALRKGHFIRIAPVARLRPKQPSTKSHRG
jgi:hypothetical protein